MTQNKTNSTNKIVEKIRKNFLPGASAVGLGIAMIWVTYTASDALHEMTKDSDIKKVSFDKPIASSEQKLVWDEKEKCFQVMQYKDAKVLLGEEKSRKLQNAFEEDASGEKYLTVSASETCAIKKYEPQEETGYIEADVSGYDNIVSESQDEDDTEERTRALRESCIVDLDGFSRELQDVDPNDKKKIELINKKIEKRIQEICGKQR